MFVYIDIHIDHRLIQFLKDVALKIEDAALSEKEIVYKDNGMLKRQKKYFHVNVCYVLKYNFLRRCRSYKV